jgi:ribonuclease T2
MAVLGLLALVAACGAEVDSEDNLLALSWQPAFCETRPRVPECRRLNGGGLPEAERQLSVHGLWPQPRGNVYCGVTERDAALSKSGRWSALAALPLDPETRARLTVAMPGTASFLHRHEWIKHGTCYSASGGAQACYADTLRVTDAINRSAVVGLLAENIGQEVSAAEICARFDAEFGPGAGDRVAMTCRNVGQRRLIGELRIGLRGRISEDVPVGDLIRAADPVAPGCERGIVDPAGLQ